MKARKLSAEGFSGANCEAPNPPLRPPASTMDVDDLPSHASNDLASTSHPEDQQDKVAAVGSTTTLAYDRGHDPAVAIAVSTALTTTTTTQSVPTSPHPATDGLGSTCAIALNGTDMGARETQGERSGSRSGVSFKVAASGNIGCDKRGEEEDVAGGGCVEASAVMPPSGGWRGAEAARGCGVTAMIPPSAGTTFGYLKSPHEMLLDEIAVSLRDTTRQPSFARIQSVQVSQ